MQVNYFQSELKENFKEEGKQKEDKETRRTV